MSYHLSQRSEKRLEGVHPDLVRVIRRAITTTPVDFAVLEGQRTPERQRHLIDIGASWTMNSRHLPDSEGIGYAVDLGAWVDGGIRWDWPLYYRIARAVRDAANQEEVALEWGGVWDRFLNDLEGGLEDDVLAYANVRRAAGKPARIDGPHYQLAWSRYPPNQ